MGVPIKAPAEKSRPSHILWFCSKKNKRSVGWAIPSPSQTKKDNPMINTLQIFIVALK
jgi:hypothetical protein